MHYIPIKYITNVAKPQQEVILSVCTAALNPTPFCISRTATPSTINCVIDHLSVYKIDS